MAWVKLTVVAVAALNSISCCQGYITWPLIIARHGVGRHDALGRQRPCDSPISCRWHDDGSTKLWSAAAPAGAGGEGSEGLTPKDILGQIFKGARQRRVNNGEAIDWACLSDAIGVGTVLVANPGVFCQGDGRPELAKKFFLPPDLAELATEPGAAQAQLDQIANLLPVVLLIGRTSEGAAGLVLNRRTGYLIGDLNVASSGFKIQPVHLGGTAQSEGICMLHAYPDVPGCEKMTEDGLYFGGNYTEAQQMVTEAKAVSFRFKFFIQQTVWGPGELEKEMEQGVWFAADVGREVLLKNRGREGTKMVKPLWTEILELMGGTYREVKDTFYRGYNGPEENE